MTNYLQARIGRASRASRAPVRSATPVATMPRAVRVQHHVAQVS